MSLICDNCFESMFFSEFFRFGLDSDFDFCESCFDAILADDLVYKSWFSRDSRHGDLEAFIAGVRVAEAYKGLSASGSVL